MHLSPLFEMTFRGNQSKTLFLYPPFATEIFWQAAQSARQIISSMQHHKDRAEYFRASNSGISSAEPPLSWCRCYLFTFMIATLVLHTASSTTTREPQKKSVRPTDGSHSTSAITGLSARCPARQRWAITIFERFKNFRHMKNRYICPLP